MLTNKYWGVLIVRGVIITLKMSVKKTKLLWPGIHENEEVMLDIGKIDLEIDSFTWVALLVKTVNAMNI